MRSWWAPGEPQHLQAALDAMDDAVLVIDRDHCIVALNRAAERLTGYPRREALGLRCFEVCAGRFCRRACDIQALFHGQATPEDFETPVFCKDGRIRLVRVRTVPLKGRGGRIVAAAQILRDITGQLAARGPCGSPRRGFGELVGESAPMNRLYEVLRALQDSDVPVLVCGEPGTEKEWAARTLHQTGLRAAGPFVRVLTHGAPPAVVERELFGTGEGDGLAPPRPGCLHLAHQGTLFIDDVAHLSPQAQQRLIEYLTRQAGDGSPDVRVVAATTGRADEPLESGSLLADLARLLSCRVELPPLRERPEDIPLLVEKLLAAIAGPDRPNPAVSEAALRVLVNYSFPGNVDELERVLRIACRLSRGGEIGTQHLPDQVLVGAGAAAALAAKPAANGQEARTGRTRPSREQLQALLNACGWNVSRCARRLSVDRTTLWRWMRQLAIDRPR